MRLFSYKMTNDSGFAPNPFGKTLTLATCKPQIRRCKQAGDWIAGFSSLRLNGDFPEHERLVYLMRVGEKIPVEDYFLDARFQDKIPDMNKPGPVAKAGDNIYHFIGNCPQQIRNPNHWDWRKDGPCEYHVQIDIPGKYVLVADNFFYFGKNAIEIPPFCRPGVPYRQSAHGKLTSPDKAALFVEYMCSQYKPGINGVPHCWPEGNIQID